MTKRVAIYTRVSTDDQTTANQDIALQAAPIIQTASKVKTYSDHATSGSIATHKRPAMRQLMDDIQAGKVDKVAIYEVSRIGRSTSDVLAFADLLKRFGVDLYIHTINIDTSAAGGYMVLTMLAAVAQLERDQLIQRIHAGITRAKLQGTKSGKPIGRAKLAEPATVDQVIDLKNQGIGINKIATQLRIGSSTVRRILAEAYTNDRKAAGN
jgi:DNA invertase Pin-like site-specific DNA recombinase